MPRRSHSIGESTSKVYHLADHFAGRFSNHLQARPHAHAAAGPHRVPEHFPPDRIHGRALDKPPFGLPDAESASGQRPGADVTSARDLDLLVADFLGGKGLLTSDGGAGFAVLTTDDGHGVGDLALGDTDGDGGLEAYLAGLLGPNVVLMKGSGSAFSVVTLPGGDPAAVPGGAPPTEDAAPGDPAPGDPDDGGSLDAYLAGLLGENLVLLHDGDGFRAGTAADGDRMGMAVAPGDLDGDGDLDGFMAKAGSNQVLLNEAGVLTAGSAPEDPRASHAVAPGGLNGDGATDVFAANAGAGNRVPFNDGAGGFTASDASGGSGRGVAVDPLIG